MALTQLEVDLANQSLAKLGAKQMTFASQTTFQGQQANLHFVQVRDSLTRSFNWQFARIPLMLSSAWKTGTVYTTDQYVWEESVQYKCAIAHTADDFTTDLGNGDWVAVSATATDVYGYSYALPADSLRLDAVIDRTSISDSKQDWQLESNNILTDETEIDIVYINKTEDTTLWDTLFTEMFINQLALAMLNPLTGIDSGAQALRNMLLGELARLSRLARVISRQEGKGNIAKVTWNDARFTHNIARRQ
jgi:hypothetical protein